MKLGLGISLSSNEFTRSSGINKSVSLSTAINNYSLYFDGAGDKGTLVDGITNNPMSAMDSGDWSLSFNINLKNSTYAKTIFWKGANFNMCLWIATDATGKLYILGSSSVGFTSISTYFNTTFSINTWHHVVLTSDSSGANRLTKCYVDGVEISTASNIAISSGTLIETPTVSNPMLIACLLGFAFYEMSMDDLVMWNSVLSPAEITEISTFNPLLTENGTDYISSANLKYWYRFKEGSGLIAGDSSGNSNGSIAISGATFTSDTPY